jgi:nucleoside 2-deoxyribosyltransferase
VIFSLFIIDNIINGVDMTTRPKEFDRGNIYLSGGMQFAANLGWREIASQKLKEMKYFPLDITELDIAYNQEHGKLVIPASDEDPLLYKANMRKHFIDTDLKLIRDNSDALIVYYDESARRGAGTVSEAQYAFNLNIPIFLVADEYETLHDLHANVSGWLIALTTKYFTSFEALYEYLDTLPYGIIKKDAYGNHGVNGDYLCHLSGEVFTKSKNRFVSQIHPLYSQKSVNVVHEVYEKHKDRYEFFMEYLENQTGSHFTK